MEKCIKEKGAINWSDTADEFKMLKTAQQPLDLANWRSLINMIEQLEWSLTELGSRELERRGIGDRKLRHLSRSIDEKGSKDRGP